MTRDELNATIEQVLFGRMWTKHPSVCINGTWYEAETWLREGESPERPRAGRAVGCKPPDWSAVVEWFKNCRPPIV